jgi:hypothetical protein
MTRSSTAFALLALTLIACGGDDGGDNSGTGSDAGQDSGGSGDIDGGTTPDGGLDADAGVEPDGGVDPDGGPAPDGGPEPDGGRPDGGDPGDGTTTDASDADAGDTLEADGGDADADTVDPGDTVDDTTPEPPALSAVLIAWTGINQPDLGVVAGYRSSGTAFGPYETFLTGTRDAIVARGLNANLGADVNGDGATDLVSWTGTSVSDPGTLNVHLGSTSGFAPFTSWRTGTREEGIGFGSTANLAGDVNGDGFDDLIAWTGIQLPSFGAIFVFPSTGTAFDASVSWRTGTAESPVSFGSAANLVGDVNGDGRDDLVHLSGSNPSSAGFIGVYLSTGTSFEASEAWASGTREVPIFAGLHANLLGDVNGDGRADLVAWSGFSGPGSFGAVNVWLSNGESFDAATTWAAGRPELAIMRGTHNLLGDVNNDGRADLVAWTGGSRDGAGAVSVMLSNGAGFDDATTWLSGTREFGLVTGVTASILGTVPAP